MRDDCLVQEGPAPPVLLGSMLDEMTVRLAPADFALTEEMACNVAGDFLPAAQIWAILRVGPFQIAAARGCVEQILTSGKDLGARQAASETLGALGDRRSLPALASLLAEPRGRANRAGFDEGLRESAVLAVGKLRDPSAVPDLSRLLDRSGNEALHATAVHALGLIGGNRAIRALQQVVRNHPNESIREQAWLTLERLRQTPRAGGEE
jgi:hypothetical protein